MIKTTFKRNKFVGKKIRFVFESQIAEFHKFKPEYKVEGLETLLRYKQGVLVMTGAPDFETLSIDKVKDFASFFCGQNEHAMKRKAMEKWASNMIHVYLLAAQKQTDDCGKVFDEFNAFLDNQTSKLLTNQEAQVH